jgi:uncharacterized protein (TIGR02147 family)
MTLYEFDDYRSFLRLRFDPQGPGKGRLKSAAAFLKVHPSRLSRILKGPDHPTPEQAFLLAQFIQLDELEARYFAELVNLERAAGPAYKRHIRQILEGLRAQAESPAKLVEATEAINPAFERIYHSSYLYAAVWLYSMVNGKNLPSTIAESLGTTVPSILRVARFLEKAGLCRWQDGRIVPSARVIKIDATSAQIETFLTTWRIHAVDRIPSRAPDAFFYSESMAIGEEAFAETKQILRKALSEIRDVLAKHPADRVVCLNIDLFDV